MFVHSNPFGNFVSEKWCVRTYKANRRAAMCLQYKGPNLFIEFLHTHVDPRTLREARESVTVVVYKLAECFSAWTMQENVIDKSVALTFSTCHTSPVTKTHLPLSKANGGRSFSRH